MACPVIADFRERFPEMTDIADADIQLHLDDACAEFDERAFGVFWEKAALLYAAHYTAQQNLNAASPVVKIRNIGVVGNTAFERAMCSTQYGQEFVTVLRRVLAESTVLNAAWRGV